MLLLKIAFTSIFVLAVSAVVSGQCPSVIVSGPTRVTNPGDSIEFRAEISAVGPRVEYSWSVSSGTIVSGQDTSKISVATDKSMSGTTVTATVAVKGLGTDCPNRASETAPLAELISCGMPVDEWELLKPNDERGRLDSFFAELANNPTSIGIVFLQVSTRDRLDPQNRRLQFVVRHAKFRNFDIKRIWFLLEPSEIFRTKLYRVPPGAETPGCDTTNCVTIKGGEF